MPEEELAKFADHGCPRPRHEDTLQLELHALRKEVAMLRARQNSESSDDGVGSLHKFWHRAGWLVMLLMFQSTSSLILERFELLIKTHPVVIYFLTMLVGAGGNAGGQSTVLVVRQLALDAYCLNEKDSRKDGARRLVFQQVWVGARLSCILFFASLLRCIAFKTEWKECMAICMSMVCIVFVSTCTGAALPLFLKHMGIDPAHAGAAIQVLMDISGVTCTCVVSCLVLQVPIFGHERSVVSNPLSSPIVVQGSHQGLHAAGEG